MMTQDELQKKIRAGAFVENNGKIFRLINMGRERYTKLKDVVFAVGDSIEIGEIRKSISFLEEEKYIKLRTIGFHAEASISDHDLEDLEAKLTGKGVRLSAGHLQDSLIVP